MSSEYESAWSEGEEAVAPANKLSIAKKAADATAADEYITAYSDLDAGMSVNGEDLKTVKPKDPAAEQGTIATNSSENNK